MIERYLVIRADFYNWNRVKVRYCDGSSFTGDVEAVESVCLGPVDCTINSAGKENDINNVFSI